LALNSGKAKNTPVTFPPGCARLLAMPLSTGSDSKSISDNRNGLSGRPKRSHYRWTNCECHIDVRGDYFRRQRSNPRRVAIGDPQNKLDLRRRAIAR
jgi:hypothetical protein